MDALLYRGFSAEAHAAAVRSEALASDPLAVALRRAASQLGRDIGAIAERWIDTAAAFWGPARVPLFGTIGAIPVSGGPEPGPIRVSMEQGSSRCRVRVAQPRSSVQVELPGGAKPAAALLFDPESEIPPAIAVFETANGVHVARFDRVSRGEYFVAISPF